MSRGPNARQTGRSVTTNRQAGSGATLFLSGFLVFNDGASTVHCIVADMTASTAVLTVRLPEMVPDSFLLVIDGDGPFKCSVTARLGTDLRVALAP